MSSRKSNTVDFLGLLGDNPHNSWLADDSDFGRRIQSGRVKDVEQLCFSGVSGLFIKLFDGAVGTPWRPCIHLDGHLNTGCCFEFFHTGFNNGGRAASP